jgi:antitoxin component HigA of HigAB toxin-antitoxin module
LEAKATVGVNGKKPLTLRIAKVLHEKSGIPAEILLA